MLRRLGIGILIGLIGGLAGAETVSAQTEGTIRGTVHDAQTKAPLSGASVTVQRRGLGMETDSEGRFRIDGMAPGTYRVRISFVGYQRVTRSVTVRAGDTVRVLVPLSKKPIRADEVVVTGSKRQEKFLEAPVQVETVSEADLGRAGGSTYWSALSTLKGIDFGRVGVNGQALSMRGFGNNFNTRVLQLKDGRVAQLPGTGLPQGNFLPTSALDVKRVEVVVGPASALYGPNAHAGVVHLLTKNPWDESGLSLDVRGGQENLVDFNGRAAGMIGEDLGWKITGQYMSATDYRPPNGGPDADASDSTHFYDENALFNEPELVRSYDIESVRAEGHLYYRFGDGWEVSGGYGFSENDNFGVTNSGRNRILDWRVQYQTLRLTGDHWFLQATHTSNDAGETYQVNGVASGAATIYRQALAGGASPAQARRQALDQLPMLREENRFVDKGELWDSELQYRNSFEVGGGTMDLVAGGQYRRRLPDSEGTFLVDAQGQDLGETEGGGYLQLDYRPTPRLRVNAAARLDGHSEYQLQLSPKAAVVYTVAPHHNVRVSVNRAFKAPTVLNRNLFLQTPGFGRVSRGNSDGFVVRRGPTSEAEVVRRIEQLRPEEVNSVEVGYKGVFGRRLFVNVVAYNAWYTDFISPLTNVANPARPSEPTFGFQNGELVAGSGFLWTYVNFGEATVRGLDLGTRLTVGERLALFGNISLIELSHFEEESVVQPLPLNTPNVKIKGGATVQNVGLDGAFVSLSGRWKSAYEFRSGFWNSAKFYDDGAVPSRGTVALTVGYSVPETGLELKASATNLFDTTTPDVLGAPKTGRMLWVSASYSTEGLSF